MNHSAIFSFFFFNDTATTEIYTLSLHDALPILPSRRPSDSRRASARHQVRVARAQVRPQLAAADGRRFLVAQPLHRLRIRVRSEEHTSELQSLAYLVCRLLLEKKKQTYSNIARL